MAINAETQEKIDALRAKISSGDEGFMGNADKAIEALTEVGVQTPPEEKPVEDLPEGSTEDPIIEDSEKSPEDSPVLPVPQADSETLESLKKLQDLAENQKAKIDADNAEKGKIGRELKEALEEKARLEAQLKESIIPKPGIEKLDVADIPRPQAPVAPVPEEGEDAFDDTFIKRQSQYLKDIEKYSGALLDYSESIQKKTASSYEEKLQAKIAEVDAKMDGINSLTEDAKRKIALDHYKQQEDVLFVEIEKLQAGNPELATKTSVRAINDKVLSFDVNNHPKNKALLDGYFSTLPKQDVDRYHRIVEVGSMYKSYDGNSMSFHKNLKNIEEAYLLSKHRKGEFKSSKQDEAERLIAAKRESQEELINEMNGHGVSEIPPDKLSGSEDLSILSQADMKRELETLNMQMSMNPMAFQKNVGSVQKRSELMLKLNIPQMR